MKKVLLIGLIIGVLFSLVATPVLADPGKVDQKVEKGIYYLVAKDSNWDPLPRSSNPFGMGKFSIENGQLTMRLTAHKLTPGDW